MKTVLHRLRNDLGTDLNKSLNFMGQARLATQAARGVGLSQFTLCFISTHENTVGEKKKLLCHMQHCNLNPLPGMEHLKKKNLLKFLYMNLSADKCFPS